MKKRFLVLGSVLAATLALGSCSIGGSTSTTTTTVDSTSTSTTTTTTTTTTTAAEPVHEHTYQDYAYLAPTYTKAGHTAYSKCKDKTCAKYFDADKNEITKDETVIPMLVTTGKVTAIDEDGTVHTDVNLATFKKAFGILDCITIQREGKDDVTLPYTSFVEALKEGDAGIFVYTDVSFALNGENKASEQLGLAVDDTFTLTYAAKGTYEYTFALFNKAKAKNAVDVKGSKIDLTYTSEQKDSYEQLPKDIVAKLENLAEEDVPFEELDAMYDQFVQNYYDLIDQYRYAAIKGDYTALQADYDIKNEILDLVNGMEAADQEIDIAFANSKYRNQYFEDMTDEEIDEYIAGLNPEASKEMAAIESAMNNALSAYEGGTMGATEALLTYLSNAAKLAEKKGEENYLVYAYDHIYGRDYTVADTDNLAEYFTTKILPSYKAALSGYQSFRAGYSKSPEWDEFLALESGFFYQFADYLDDYAVMMGGDYLENYRNYFITGNYFYSNNAFNENVTGYVTSFADGTPLMFLGAGYQGQTTFIHEFGHFNAAVTGGDSVSYDLDEVHSQGNEMLYYLYLQNTEAASSYALTAFLDYQLYAMLNSVVYGFLFNEMEKYMYGLDQAGLDALMTLPEGTDVSGKSEEEIKELQYEAAQVKINAKWAEICEKYDMGSLASNTDYMMLVLLNYNGYYISYATSAIGALELYALGTKDYEAAVAAYKVIFADHARTETFASVFADAGLTGIFDPATYETIYTAIVGEN